MSPRHQRRKARKIFISYSREGGQGYALSLSQGLAQVLGKKNVFLDVVPEAMEPGRSWRESVREALGRCDTLLLVFDPGVASRLAEPKNAVLFELETAVENGVTIVCVRVGGARLPDSSALPASLVGLPEWHSPEVHSDAAVADIERVIKELTGRIPGQVPVVDRWDLAVLGVLALLGAAAWLSKGRFVLNLGESWLWGAALVAPWLIWMAGRRALPIGSRGRASLRYRQAASWLAVLVVFAGGWLWARESIYRLPEFAAESGILVSRFEGDPKDEQQRELALSLLGNKQADSAVELPSSVAVLPRRVGFASSVGLASYLDNGHAEARRYGLRARAAVVLWGKLLAPVEAMRRLAVNLTFIESEALFKTFGSEVVGAMEARELNGLENDLDRLAKTLPQLLEGYRRYHAAETERDFGLAEREFSDAILALEEDSPEDPGERRALDEILASLHFYRGNTFLALAREEEAMTEYETALSRAPRYIEAASNLGWLLKRAGEPDRAVAILSPVDSECARASRLKRSCAYVWYNLGDALGDRNEHEKASVLFKLAIERIQRLGRTGEDVEDRRLEGFSHQNLAYSLVRRAAASDADGKPALLEEAQGVWEIGVQVLEGAELEVPEYFRITRGRIYIERREWRQAIEVLSSLEVPSDRRASVDALLAGAHYCVAEVEQAQKYLGALVASGVSGPMNEGFRISIAEGMKEAGRIQKMCGGAQSTGAR